MTAKVSTDPRQKLAGVMGGSAPQPITMGADVDPLVRFDQKTSGRANKAARSLMNSGSYAWPQT